MKTPSLPAFHFRGAMLCLVVLGSLSLSGCGDSDYVRNDDYEKMPEPDYALRQLLGVRTLRTSFEMPENMRSFRVGLILIEEGKVVGSQGWHSGDGLHRVHSEGKREYANTIHVDYLNWKSNEAWSQKLIIRPSFFQSFPEIDEQFWENFESLRTSGYNSELNLAPFRDFYALGALFGAKESMSMGGLKVILSQSDYTALLVVEFFKELQQPGESPRERPPNEELQEILEDYL